MDPFVAIACEFCAAIVGIDPTRYRAEHPSADAAEMKAFLVDLQDDHFKYHVEQMAEEVPGGPVNRPD